MAFTEKLQKLRKSNGMSQENLAEAVGVSRQAVSKWESGQSYPEMDKLIAISELFQISLDSLVKDEGNNSCCNFNENYKYRFHYEYKSRRTLLNLPLVHVNIGRGIYTAKGIIAVGNISIGLISLGILSLGGLCIGSLSLGLLSLAAVSLGLIFSIGGISIGVLAVGGLSIGVFSLGGLSLGMFSFGGYAAGSYIAAGDYARGHIAIGETVHGIKTVTLQNHSFNKISPEIVRNLINQEYPGLWKPVREFVLWLFRLCFW